MAGPIRISILANASQANRTFQQTASTAQRVGGGFRKMALPATAALGAIAGAAKVALDSVARIERINAQTAAVLKSTGNAAGVSAKHVENLAGRMERLTATEAESVQEGANVLLTFTNIRNGVGKTNKIFDQSVSIVTDMSRALGTDLKQQSIQVGKALNDPIKGISALSRVGVSFTEQQKKQITRLTENGKAMEAQKIILAELNKEFGGSGKAFAKTTEGQIELAKHEFGTLTESLVVGLLPAIRTLAGVATKGFKWLGEHQTAAKVLIGVLAGLAVSILAVNAAMAINPATLVVAGLVALGVALTVAYRRSETFRNGVQAVGDVFMTKVVPAAKAVGGFFTGTLVPIFVRTGQSIGRNLKPIVDQLGTSFRTKVRPALAQVVAKFEDWWPTIRKVIAVAVTLYGRWLSFQAMIVGKVVPVLIRFQVAILSRVIPAVIGIIEKAIAFGKAVGNAAQDVAGFAKSVGSKVADVVRTIAGLPGKAKAAVAGALGWLRQAGVDLIQGLLNGIDSMISKVTDKLNGLKDKVTGVAGDIGGALNPFDRRAPGTNPYLAMLSGVTDGGPGVTKSLAALTKSIDKTFDTRLDATVARLKKRLKGDALTAAVDRATKANAKAHKTALAQLKAEQAALVRNGRAQDSITTKLENARQALTDARKAATDYAASIRDGFLAFGSITSLGEGTGFANADQLVSNLKSKVAQAKQYAEMIKQLIKAKLNPTTLQQLIEAGVDGGFGTAQTLLNGGASVIAQVNSLTGQLNAAGQSLGNSAASHFHGAGITAAQGIVSGLESQADQLDRAAIRLANRLARAVKKALGGKGAGADAARELANGRVVLEPGATNVVTQHITVKVEATPGTNRMALAREIQSLLDDYQRNGGRKAA